MTLSTIWQIHQGIICSADAFSYDVGALSDTTPLELLIGFLAWRNTFLFLSSITFLSTTAIALYVRGYPFRGGK